MDNPDATEALIAASEGLPVESFAAGAVLIAEGPGRNELFILLSGEIEVLRGETPVAEVSMRGAVFGEIAALLGGAHTATVRAATAVTAYHIADAADFLRQHPQLSFHVATILARRLVDATTYLADFKRQFGHRGDHFGMVDEVLDALVQRQGRAAQGGPARGAKADPRL